MPVRWVICPVDVVDGVRRPHVSGLPDPGRTLEDGVTPQGLAFCAVISDGLPGQVNDWCLCQVWGVDFSLLDADPQIVNFLEFDYVHESFREALGKTLRDSGIQTAKLKRIRDRLEANGIDTSDFTLDTPIWQVVAQLGRLINPHFDPRLEFTSLGDR